MIHARREAEGGVGGAAQGVRSWRVLGEELEEGEAAGEIVRKGEVLLEEEPIELEV